MNKYLFLLISILLIALTRSHAGFLSHLPDLTLPLLILAGVKFRENNIALTIILFSVLVDNFAIFYQGVSAHCITPAYSILLMSYYAIFYFAKYLTFNLTLKNILGFITLIYSQWLIATTSYYAFTTKYWSEFSSYASQWVWLETYPSLIVISVFFTFFAIKPKLSRA
jgi:hypothetical protein